MLYFRHRIYIHIYLDSQESTIPPLSNEVVHAPQETALSLSLSSSSHCSTMETAESVSYDFPGHAMSALESRRLMDSSFAHNLPFYSHSTAPFSVPFHATSSPTSSSSSPASSAANYSFGHILNGHQHQHQHHHHHHPSPFHQLFVTGHHHQQQTFNNNNNNNSSQSLHHRLSSSESPPLHSLPEIRPAKNALCRVPGDQSQKLGDRLGTHLSISHPSSHWGVHKEDQNPATEAEFSTEVDILMKAIQSKVGSRPVVESQSLPPLQQVTHDSAHAFPSAYSSPMPQSTASYPLPLEGQTTASGKKRKYTCTLPHCGKCFSQKTHLDIHMRAHTGDKPFVSRILSVRSSIYIYIYIYIYSLQTTLGLMEYFLVV